MEETTGSVAGDGVELFLQELNAMEVTITAIIKCDRFFINAIIRQFSRFRSDKLHFFT
jgi:hypothetical protein